MWGRKSSKTRQKRITLSLHCHPENAPHLQWVGPDIILEEKTHLPFMGLDRKGDKGQEGWQGGKSLVKKNDKNVITNSLSS